jgi:transcriptional regulator of arginine metabolism
VNADLRSRRQKALADIIRSGSASSQEEVTSRLAGLGYAVTQATVSRDLDQLGAVKVKRSGLHVYALPDQIGASDWAAGRLQRIVSEWVQGVEAAGNLVVIKTPPGSAHLVSLAIDQSNLPEIAGTVSGDDTLFVAVKDGVTVGAIANRFRELSGR